MPAVHLPVRLFRLGAALALLLGAAVGPAAAAPLPPGPAAGEATTAVYGGGALQACSANAAGTQTVDSGSFQSLVFCNLSLGQSGQVLVLANASVGLVGGTDLYEANFRLDHNTGLTGDNRTDRYVDVYPDSALITSGDGTDRNVAISALYTVTAGVHTFALLAKRTEGDDPVETIDATISALFIPTGADLQACSGMVDGLWTNNSNTLYPSVKCSLTVPRPGLVFVSADAWTLLEVPTTNPYEAAHFIQLDGVIPADTGVRYTDVYTNTGDGIDTTVAATQVFTVTPGLHEFKLVFRQQTGPGTARMADAALVALYVPFDSRYAHACGAHGAAEATFDTSSNTALVGCTLAAPSDSWAFVSATANMGLGDEAAALEAQFHLARNTTSSGLTPSTRYLNSYPDANDGLDGSLAVSLLTTVPAGSQNFHLIGRRFAGDGNFVVREAVLFVLVPRAPIFLPLILK